MIDANRINELDKFYFNEIKLILERNGTTFFNNLISHYQIEDSWINYSGKMSFIQEGVERVVQSIISDNVDWEICSTPVGADSVFMTPKAVIHIDSKAIKYNDDDATSDKITLSKNQTSYYTNQELVYAGAPFKSNLPTTYNHKIYGQVVCLTYFVKVIYDLREGMDSFRNFKVRLCSIPNGLLEDIYGEVMSAGRTLKRVVQDKLKKDNYDEIISSADTGQRLVFERSYVCDSNNDYVLSENLTKDEKKEVQRVYNEMNLYVERQTARINFNDFEIDNNDNFKWKRSVEIDLK